MLGCFCVLPPVGSFLPIAAENLPRRVSRSPATLRHGNRDTSPKPPGCMRLWRIQPGGFQRAPAETHGFCTSFAACFTRWRKTGYTFITLRSVFDGICIGNQKAYSSGVPDKTSVLLGRGDTAPWLTPAAYGGRKDTKLVSTICPLIAPSARGRRGWK